jgi:predicted metal-dependent peptidase
MKPYVILTTNRDRRRIRLENKLYPYLFRLIITISSSGSIVLQNELHFLYLNQ